MKVIIIILSVFWIGFICGIQTTAGSTESMHQILASSTPTLLMMFATAQLRLNMVEMLLYDAWKSSLDLDLIIYVT